MKKKPAKVQYKDYAEYLKSEKWEHVKKEYAKHNRIDYCLCCGGGFNEPCVPRLKPNYHHFRYATDWNNDTFENVIILCEDCHNFAHAYFQHNSEYISALDYLSTLIISYKDDEKQTELDLSEHFLINDIIVSFDLDKCNVVLNKFGNPQSVLIESTDIKSYKIAEAVLATQKMKHKEGGF